jgi:hypothetical protein
LAEIRNLTPEEAKGRRGAGREAAVKQCHILSEMKETAKARNCAAAESRAPCAKPSTARP